MAIVGTGLPMIREAGPKHGGIWMHAAACIHIIRKRNGFRWDALVSTNVGGIGAGPACDGHQKWVGDECKLAGNFGSFRWGLLKCPCPPTEPHPPPKVHFRKACMLT